VVKKSRVAKGTFYHYFKSKDELIVELYKVLMFEIEKNCVTEYKGESAREYSFNVFGSIVKWFITHPHKFNYIVIFETSPYIKEVVGTVGETLKGPLANTLSFPEPRKCFEERFRMVFDMYWDGVSQN
jgi:AcrR family transcriptional regulator